MSFFFGVRVLKKKKKNAGLTLHKNTRRNKTIKKYKKKK